MGTGGFCPAFPSHTDLAPASTHTHPTHTRTNTHTHKHTRARTHAYVSHSPYPLQPPPPPSPPPPDRVRRWVEHRYVWDANTRRFDGHAAAAGGSAGRGGSVENHASLDVFDVGLTKHAAAPHALLCALEPGEALFLPALWSHAVVSEPEPRVEGEAPTGEAPTGETPTEDAVPEDELEEQVTAGRPKRQPAAEQYEAQGGALVGSPISALVDAHAGVRLGGGVKTPPPGHVVADPSKVADASNDAPNDANDANDAPNDAPNDAHGSGLNLAVNLWFIHESRTLFEAVRLQPEWAAGYFCLGDNLRISERPAEARWSYMQALRLRPDYADAALNLAAVEETLGSAGAAEMLYAHASKLRPLDPKAPTNRGLVLRKMGRLEEAEASYRRAIALAPNEARAHSALGNTLALQASLTRVICSGATSPTVCPHASAAPLLPAGTARGGGGEPARGDPTRAAECARVQLAWSEPGAAGAGG